MGMGMNDHQSVGMCHDSLRGYPVRDMGRKRADWATDRCATPQWPTKVFLPRNEMHSCSQVHSVSYTVNAMLTALVFFYFIFEGEWLAHSKVPTNLTDSRQA